MPSSTNFSDLHLPSSSTSNLVSLQSLNHALPIKLDRNNYIIWKTQMENVVYANGFEEYINGTKPCPPQELHTSELNPTFVQWRRFDRMLRLEFQTTKKGVDPMLEYILKIKTISDNLVAIGEPVKESDHILQLLGGLDSEYNTIMASLTTHLPFAVAHIVPTPSTQHPRPHQPKFQSLQPRFQSHHSGNHQQVPFLIPDPITDLITDLLTDLPHPLLTYLLTSLLALNANCVEPMVYLLHRTLLHYKPCLLQHQIIKISSSLTPEQPTISVILLRLSLMFNRTSVLALTPGAIWHSRLGHLAAPILSKALAYYNPSVSFQINKIAPCKICPLAKSHSLLYSLSSSHVSQPLALIHTDLWGLAPSPSTLGARFFLLFIDDYSRYTWIYFLSAKDQALSTFITFRKMIENQLNSTIKCIHSDNGREFIAFKPDLEAHGIVHQFSCPQTPQQNGRAKRKISHFVETDLLFVCFLVMPRLTKVPIAPPLQILFHHYFQVPFAPTPSPTLSSSPSPLNTHPMVTRAKSGIHKKNSFLMQTTIVKSYTIRLILALAISFQWPVRQLDVENAFLNGDLQDEAPRAWFQKLRVALVDYGFQSSRTDTSLFIHHTASDILILLIYMDDILVTGSNPKLQGSVLHLNQQKYIANLLHRTQMEASKPVLTPVGALQYVTLTRPDIAFVVNKACQFMAKPSDVHWDIVMLTRPPVRMIAGAPTDIVSSLAQISSHGPPPNNA
ncbi:Retrovirus-related Pol polyprotein from transposon RE1 [Vitis vinifera]|uniref:Retrovirus-related Pol polyprotein from transposon RE1 n=1 Tax=Vitis vinifera TaxID=29760 RepID=A0A438K6D7_VITVI|nr:Retrovirus-related Pol polyprotein from transposon RE1 [Vitis vinifera]